MKWNVPGIQALEKKILAVLKARKPYSDQQRTLDSSGLSGVPYILSSAVPNLEKARGRGWAGGGGGGGVDVL